MAHPGRHARLIVAMACALLVSACAWLPSTTPAGVPTPASSGSTSSGSESATPTAQPSVSESPDGVGDPYFPDAGGSGYDAVDYAIKLAWNPKTEQLSGSTTMSAVATRDLKSVHVDLSFVPTSASVNGQATPVLSSGATDRSVSPATPIRQGETFSVRWDYAGRPGDYSTPDGRRPFEKGDGHEVLIADEPGSAPAWFASNDHPSDPATYDIQVTVPTGLAALSVGKLVSKDSDSDPATATWHWKLERPAATYLTFLAVGDFAIEQGSDGGRPFVYAVSRNLKASNQKQVLAQLRKTGSIVRAMEARLGTYPWPDLGGVVVSTKAKWAALECAGRPVYHVKGQLEESIQVHELAHQWFGNNVALASWRDVVNNEGWATYIQMTMDAQGGPSNELQDQVTTFWEALYPSGFPATPLGDPGRDEMFAPRSYFGGALALAALRNVIGQQAFDSVERTWAQTNGPRSLRDFQLLAETLSGRDLTDFWKAWYASDQAPPKAPEYGYPR